MKPSIYLSLSVFTLCCFLIIGVKSMSAQPAKPLIGNEVVSKLETELVAKYGESQRVRLQRGMKQVLSLWRADDGNEKVFEDFVRENFAGDQQNLDNMFFRFQYILDQIDGHMHEIILALHWQVDLDIGPILPFDEMFAGYNPSAHIEDDFFKNKIAFTALLNFPIVTLDEQLTGGTQWTRRQWAESKLTQRFSRRVPSEVELVNAQTSSEARNYIAQYNIWMHHLVNDEGNRLFPPKLRLLSHWNLRDEIKAQYADTKTGLTKQRTIQKVMERIVNQTIPAVVVNNPHVDWNPFTNNVKLSTVVDVDQPPPTDMRVTNTPEQDKRYEILLTLFQASHKVDPYSPTEPTLIARKFNEERRIPEQRVKQIFEKVVSSPLVAKVAKLINARLGRPLEPFDIWYNGFRPRSSYTEQKLDEIVSQKYPTANSFEKDIPNILRKLGFSPDRADYLASNIVVDPARGSGHAWGAEMRGAKAHLRTRVGENGMNYKGYNIAVHELGHNVEQVFSLNDVDFTLLRGVPNTAFTEAIAFVFQANDLAILGLTQPDVQSEATKALNDFWQTYEIAGVALVDMEVWHWMYDHPKATPEELKEAVLSIARNMWNKYYAPIFNIKDVTLLGIYSHMIQSSMYLPDYPLGHLIAFQIEEHIKKSGSIGSEVERMTKIGSIAPDLWMNIATGSVVGPEALLSATAEALKELGK